MIRVRFVGGKLSLVLAVILALLIVNAVTVSRFSDPAGAVRAKAEELSGADVPLLHVAGGYSSSFFGMTAHGRFEFDEGGTRRVLELELSRPAAFMPWRLEEYRVRPREPHKLEGR